MPFLVPRASPGTGPCLVIRARREFLRDAPHRFLHAADLHLDSPFVGLGERDPELAQRLRDASLTALDRLVQVAIERQCHFVVLAGDIYDGVERGIRAQLALRTAAERLHAARIPLVMLHGNHDPLDLGYTAVHHWPDSTTLVPGDAPRVVELETPAGRVTVTGQSFPRKRVPESLAASYPPPSGPGLHIAALHTELVRGEESNDYSPCALSELLETDFHYWALGHVHEPRVLHDGSPVVAYPGNLQGRHFLESGPRGALLVEGLPHELKTELVPLAPFRFERLAMDVTEIPDLASLQAKLLDAAPADDATVLVRAELTGRSPLYSILQDGERRGELLAGLNQASGESPVWMEVRADILPDLQWENLERQPSLSGALVRREHSAAEVRAVLRSVPRLKALASTLDDDDLVSLAKRALYRVVDAVHPREGA